MSSLHHSNMKNLVLTNDHCERDVVLQRRHQDNNSSSSCRRSKANYSVSKIVSNETEMNELMKIQKKKDKQILKLWKRDRDMKKRAKNCIRINERIVKQHDNAISLLYGTIDFGSKFNMYKSDYLDLEYY